MQDDAAVCVAPHEGELLPPFWPVHVQLHGPLPEMDAAVPVCEQSPADVAADASAYSLPSAAPQAPFTGCGVLD